jgi:hypothetical protein
MKGKYAAIISILLSLITSNIVFFYEGYNLPFLSVIGLAAIYFYIVAFINGFVKAIAKRI